MKAIKFYAIISVLAIVSVSCVENSDKYKAAVAQRDSIAFEKQALDSNYQQTIVLLNDIETGFSEISRNEGQLKYNLKGVEGSKTSKRDLIGAQMQAIKETMEQNKLKIEELQRLNSKNGKTNNLLSETIKRLQSEMMDRENQIQTLQAELEQKNIKITELSTTVDVQSKNIAEQKNVMEQQKSTLKGQDTDLNSVWYIIATSKELKEAKVVSGGGLFQSKKVLNADIDKQIFTQVDLRNVASIPTNSRKVKILSSHPENSYVLVPGTDKNITIEIKNPSKFWSVSKYLVVQI